MDFRVMRLDDIAPDAPISFYMDETEVLFKKPQELVQMVCSYFSNHFEEKPKMKQAKERD